MGKNYNSWQTTTFKCDKCGWTGLGADAKFGECYDTFAEKLCPQCPKSTMLFTIEFPTVQQMRDNWENLDKADRLQVLVIEQQQKEFAARCLNSPDQLPDLEGNDLVLVWDIGHRQKGGDTLIKYGDDVLWREPAIFEGYERFLEVAGILKEKYKNQLQDLVPTRCSGLWLYGDRLASLGIVRTCRTKLGEYSESKAAH